jgi:hypothetical protein
MKSLAKGMKKMVVGGKAKATFEVGDNVWVPHEEHAWLNGIVKADSAQELVVTTHLAGQVTIPKGKKLPQYGTVELCGDHLSLPVENLVDLDEMSEGAILYHVRKRYLEKKIYTFVGAILIAVNPFQKCDIYGQREISLAANQAESFSVLTPHVFAIGALAYAQMKATGKAQSVLISGESGAGKTETTKKVLSYLASVAKSSFTEDGPSMEDRIMDSNPILEAFGNAKTLRNDNSSRFGKWMKVNFNSQHLIIGSEIVNYLLEKSRVVVQTKGERNYHVFYFLLAGADPDLKSRLHLKSVDDYKYTNKSGCNIIAGVNDIEEFNVMVSAMNTLQFSDELRDTTFEIIASILQLGNVTFVNKTDAAGQVYSEINPASRSWLEDGADLLGMKDVDQLGRSLTQKIVTMGGPSKGSKRKSTVVIKLNDVQAADSRDNLCKYLYAVLFDLMVVEVNKTLANTAPTVYNIGILDIFGFEVFDTNSLEQLCINYSNEKLQQHFNEIVFEKDMSLYRAEGVPTDKVDFVDNSACVQLIEGKPLGILNLLQEECSLGAATDTSFVTKVDKSFGDSAGERTKKQSQYFIKNRREPLLFSVKHFAGAVEYSGTDFLEKSRSTLNDSLRAAMEQSSNVLIASFFISDGDGGKKSTIGSQFRDQLVGLVATLKQTESSFVRCVKPNWPKKPFEFEGPLTLRQLKYSGLFEAIRIRKSGYSYRMEHMDFLKLYSILDPAVHEIVQKSTTGNENKMLCNRLLQTCTSDELVTAECWSIGLTKVFIKSTQDKVALDRKKNMLQIKSRITLQAFCRMVTMRCRFYATLYQSRMRKKEEAEARAQAEAAEALAQAEAREARRKRILLKMNMATRIQKLCRGKKARANIQAMLTLKRLSVAVKEKKMETIVALMNELRSRGLLSDVDAAPYESKANVDIMLRCPNELKLANSLNRLLTAQDKCIADLKVARAMGDLSSLRALVDKAGMMQIDENNHSLRLARGDIDKLEEKKTTMLHMVEFLLTDEKLYSKFFNSKVLVPTPDDPNVHADLLTEARNIRIDPTFVSCVQERMDAVTSAILVRDVMRRAIKYVDEPGIVAALAMLDKINEIRPRFAAIERRAALHMLKLIQLRSLCYNSAPREPPEIKNLGRNALLPQNILFEHSKLHNPLLPPEAFDLLESTDPELMRPLDVYKRNGAVRNDKKTVNVGRKRFIDAVGAFVSDLPPLTDDPVAIVERNSLLLKGVDDLILYLKWSKTMCVWEGDPCADGPGICGLRVEEGRHRMVEVLAQAEADDCLNEFQSSPDRLHAAAQVKELSSPSKQQIFASLTSGDVLSSGSHAHRPITGDEDADAVIRRCFHELDHGSSFISRNELEVGEGLLDRARASSIKPFTSELTSPPNRHSATAQSGPTTPIQPPPPPGRAGARPPPPPPSGAKGGRPPPPPSGAKGGRPPPPPSRHKK